MRERAILFGSHRGLVGVVTEPATPAPGPRRAVVMSNIGLHHRVGPFRLYVELARLLAAQGWYVLRFDLSGLGDSAARTGALGDAERAALDVSEALDWLGDRLGVARFVLLGLCSGVDSTHAVAVADPRVAGAVFIDGYTYPTAGFRLRHHTRRYLQGGRWARFARRRLRRLASGRPPAPAEPAAVFTREYPPLERFRADVARMVARGARLLFVFTGTVDVRYNHRGQLFEMLGPTVPREHIEVELYRSADHLFTATAARAELTAHVGRWLAAFDE